MSETKHTIIMLGKLYQEKIHKFGENNAVCEKKKNSEFMV